MSGCTCDYKFFGHGDGCPSDMPAMQEGHTEVATGDTDHASPHREGRQEDE